MTTYEEKLTAPVGLYAVAWVMSFALGLSFFVVLGPVAGLLALGAPGVLASVVLTRAAAVVRVADGQLTAGEARIPVQALGRVRTLDAEQARQVRGPASDPAGYHLIRGWVPAGVLAEVTDPEDPTPYWFVATRHPQRLADALEASRARPGP